MDYLSRRGLSPERARRPRNEGGCKWRVGETVPARRLWEKRMYSERGWPAVYMSTVQGSICKRAPRRTSLNRDE
ncbi:hypothetical protein LY78DRAFT_313081 [Colletotrichum sublineola]|nr:hypothetical protein LY78DRAFT_313081 [Colletotrichum sublineola]